MASILGTYTLSSESKTVLATDNVNYLSIVCLSGTVTVLCESKTVPSWGLTNSPIVLALGASINVKDTLTIQPLDGITIDATSGSAGIIVG